MSTTITLVGAILTSLSSLHYGYNISILNSISSAFLECDDYSASDCIPLSTGEWGWIVGVMYLGCLVGSICGGFYLSKYSSIFPCQFWSACLGGVGNVICALSSTSQMLSFGRFVIGVGIGSCCLTTPLYLLNNSPSPSKRAAFCSINPTFIGIGILVAELLGCYAGGDNTGGNGGNWRILLGLGALPFLVQLVFLPTGFILKTNIEKNGNNWTLGTLLKNPISHRSFMVSSILHIGQQLSGINAILQFSSLIFKEDRGVMIAVLILVMGLVSMFLLERLGRRWIGLGSSFWMTIGLLVVMASMVKNQPFLGSIGVILYISSYSVGLGPLPWVMVGEMFPADAAGPASSFVVCLNWIFNMAVSVSYPSLKDFLGFYSLLPFAIFMGVFFVWALFSFPETKGRPITFL